MIPKIPITYHFSGEFRKIGKDRQTKKCRLSLNSLLVLGKKTIVRIHMGKA